MTSVSIRRLGELYIQIESVTPMSGPLVTLTYHNGHGGGSDSEVGREDKNVNVALGKEADAP